MLSSSPRPPLPTGHPGIVLAPRGVALPTPACPGPLGPRRGPGSECDARSKHTALSLPRSRRLRPCGCPHEQVPRPDGQRSLAKCARAGCEAQPERLLTLRPSPHTAEAASLHAGGGRPVLRGSQGLPDWPTGPAALQGGQDGRGARQAVYGVRSALSHSSAQPHCHVACSPRECTAISLPT